MSEHTAPTAKHGKPSDMRRASARAARTRARGFAVQ
ncbi:MAG: hypothetical protein RIR92_988, partial [Pseudomonadota bacterium]